MNDERVVELIHYLRFRSTPTLALFTGYCVGKVCGDPTHPFWDLIESFKKEMEEMEEKEAKY